MRKLTQTKSSSTNVLTIVIVCIAGLIAFTVGTFLIVRFLETRRRMRGDAAIEAGKAVSKNKQHRRRFSQTEYEDLPRSLSVRKRRFSTGTDEEDVWGNLMDATLPGDDEFSQAGETMTTFDKIKVEDVNDVNDVNDTSEISLSQISAPSKEVDIISPDIASAIEPASVFLDAGTSPRVAFELCHPDELKDLCISNKNSRFVQYSNTPILPSPVVIPESPTFEIRWSNKPIIVSADLQHADRHVIDIPPELSDEDLHLHPLTETNILLANDFDYANDPPKSYPINITDSSQETSSVSVADSS